MSYDNRFKFKVFAEIHKRGNEYSVVIHKDFKYKEFVGNYKTVEEAEIARDVSVKQHVKEKRWIEKHRKKLKDEIAKERLKKLGW